MTAIGNWRFLRAGSFSQLASAPAASLNSSLSEVSTEAVGKTDAGHAASRAIALAIAGLRQSPPVCFSDSPDHDFVALVDRYSGALQSVLPRLSGLSGDRAHPALIDTLARMQARHVEWSRDWRRRAQLGEAWILDGASVRYRFVHDRLREDLASLPGACAIASFGGLATAISGRTIDLASAALDLCRDREVRSHALWLRSMATVIAAGFRDLRSLPAAVSPDGGARCVQVQPTMASSAGRSRSSMQREA